MADVIQFRPKKAPGGEIVTRDRSYEWGNIWGYIPDPDPILLRSGLSSEVLEKCLADGHVLACYQSRKAGVINAEFKLVYPKGSEGLSEYFDSLVATLPIYDVIAQMLDAPFYGFSVNEVIWRERGGKWVPVDVAQKPNEWFVWDKLNRLRFLSRYNMIEGELLPNYKFIVARHFPSFQNPYGIRIMSRCLWPVSFKKGGFKYWTMFVEKFGIPWTLGRVPPGTEAEARDVLLTTMEKMVQSACAVINDDESIEIMETKGKADGGGGGGAVFHALVDACNAEISKAILTQTLSTEIGDKGAYAATQSHLAVRSELCQMDKRMVAGCFNQLFTWCALLNFNSFQAPKFVFVEEDDAREAHSRRDSNLSSQGVRFEPAYYERQYNLRPGEFTVTDPQLAGFGGGQPSDNVKSANEAKQKDQRAKDRQTLPNKG